MIDFLKDQDKLRDNVIRILYTDCDDYINTIVDAVMRTVDSYLAGNRTLQLDVTVVLALHAIHCERQFVGESHWGLGAYAKPDDVLKRLSKLGFGSYHYMLYAESSKVDVPSYLRVLQAELFCTRYGLKSQKLPAGDGNDILFSLDKIENPVFDNAKYIPSLRGYYTIIGAGAARD